MPEPVISTSIKTILESLSINSIQLIPLSLTLPDNNSVIGEYFLLHIITSIDCINGDKSDIEYSKSGNTIFGIDKLVLSQASLETVKLEDRLVFVLSDNTSICLFHKTVVDKIQSASLTGLRFLKVADWNSDVVFE